MTLASHKPAITNRIGRCRPALFVYSAARLLRSRLDDFASCLPVLLLALRPFQHLPPLPFLDLGLALALAPPLLS